MKKYILLIATFFYVLISIGQEVEKNTISTYFSSEKVEFNSDYPSLYLEHLTKTKYNISIGGYIGYGFSENKYYTKGKASNWDLLYYGASVKFHPLFFFIGDRKLRFNPYIKGQIGDQFKYAKSLGYGKIDNPDGSFDVIIKDIAPFHTLYLGLFAGVDVRLFSGFNFFFEYGYIHNDSKNYERHWMNDVNNFNYRLGLSYTF
jgi:hypothetical protein